MTPAAHGREGRDLLAVGVALGIALLGSTGLRTVSAELNRTLGTVWPFALAHCESGTAPGCEGRGAGMASHLVAHLATR